MTKQTIITSVNEVWRDPVDPRNTLSTVIDEDNVYYSTSNGAYYSTLIGQPIVLKWNEEAGKKINPKTGKPYINKNLYEGPTQLPKLQPKSPAILQLENLTRIVEKLTERMDNAGL